MVKCMTYKDQIEKEIDKANNNSKLNILIVLLCYVPSLISSLIFSIFQTELWATITGFLLFGAFVSTFILITRSLYNKQIAKEIRSIKMYSDNNYNSRVKVLSNYNRRYEYSTEIGNGLKFYLIFSFVLISFLCIILSGLDDKLFEAILYIVIILLFIVPVIYFIRKNIIKGKINLDHEIITRLNPKVLKIKTMQPLLDSKLYPFINNIPEFTEIEKGYTFEKKLTEKIVNRTNVYFNDCIYDLNDFKIYLYSVVNYDSGEGSNTSVSEERTILFEFDKDSIAYDIMIKDNDVYSDYDIDAHYYIKSGECFLNQESRVILDEIYKNDVIDIYCHNKKVYIKKYLPREIYKEDFEEYLKSLELYKKFVDTLM